ncbi:hypothetical protein C1H46_017333 [Malus baccata]|uniref:Uncharacterized protein n=1 Tax=Malus baccata TaxID=106549 RepID=A0A540ME65_MALBA|nr:hypothetical protein C1H46_017333 [Malus baccata]
MATTIGARPLRFAPLILCEGWITEAATQVYPCFASRCLQSSLSFFRCLQVVNFEEGEIEDGQQRQRLNPLLLTISSPASLPFVSSDSGLSLPPPSCFLFF